MKVVQECAGMVAFGRPVMYMATSLHAVMIPVNETTAAGTFCGGACHSPDYDEQA
jgi:hypothetical protein